MDSDTVKKEKKKNRKELSTTKKIILGFMVAIFIGTILLSLPISTVDGSSNILTALFTATTSICVTGLVVVDTFAYWSLFGKIVILILIQLGGLGVVVFTSAILLLLHKKVTLKERMTIQDSFGLNGLKGMVVFVKKVILGTFIVEIFGMLLYMIEFIPKFGVAKGIWFALFNSVSAFCNAGMDIIGNDSLMSFSSSPLVLVTTMILIVSGGLGFVVWWDIIDNIKKIKRNHMSVFGFFRRLSVHTKIVLSMTISLILTGFVMIFFFEYNNPDTIGNMSLGDKLLNSLFQSVTFRTAGFASVDQGALRETSAGMGIMYMLIGGSPVGTAGGMKTITFAIILFTIFAVIKGRNQTIVFGKSINEGLIKRALAVAFIMIFNVFLMNTLLMITNDLNLVDSCYETSSAIATVGLSRGVTSALNPAGQIIIIICMFLGRIGPISLFVAFSGGSSIKNSMKYSEAEIYVG